MSSKTTLEYIIDNHCSVARFGDGELKAMLEEKMPFENPTITTKERLISAFNCRDKRILICLTSAINFKLNKYTREATYYYYNFLQRYYRRIYYIIDKKYKYGNALFTRFYIDYKKKNSKQIDKHVDLLKKIWKNRNILLIEGTLSKVGVGNDFLSNASSIRRIICPPKNCMEISRIIEKSIISNYQNNDIVILALGPTASYLSVKLTLEHNIQCIDLGHADVEYIWFLNHVKEKTTIAGKYSAEAKTNEHIILNMDEEKYRSQIIKTIS